MGVAWIKITTSIFDDEKIKIIDTMPDHDAILVVWIKLLTLAGKCNNGGVLSISDALPYTDEMLSAVFNRPLNTVKMSLDVFEKLEMIERHTSISIVNWEKHQNEAALTTIREHDAERKRIQRQRNRVIEACPGHVPDKSRNVRILELEEEIEKEEEKREEPVLSFETSCKKISETWNGLSIKPEHRYLSTFNFTTKEREGFSSAFAKYKLEEVINAITNYSAIISRLDLYEPFPRGYTLPGFLATGIEQYIDSADPFTRCKRVEKKAAPEKRDSVEVPDSEATRDFLEGMKKAEEEAGGFEFNAADMLERIRNNSNPFYNHEGANNGR